MSIRGSVTLFLVIVCLPCFSRGLRAESGDGDTLIAGVDLVGLAGLLGLEGRVWGKDSGLQFRCSDSNALLSVGLWSNSDRAREAATTHPFWGPSIPSLGRDEGIGDEVLWWARNAVMFVRDNAVCLVSSGDAETASAVEDTTALAHWLDAQLQTRSEFVVRSDRPPVLRVSLVYPAQANARDSIEVRYSAVGADGVVIGSGPGFLPPRGAFDYAPPRDRQEQGYWVSDIRFISSMCVMATAQMRIKILPAEDGDG